MKTVVRPWPLELIMSPEFLETTQYDHDRSGIVTTLWETMLDAQDTIAEPTGRASDFVRDFSSGRRLSDKVLHVFNFACVVGDFRTATMLLAILEDMAKHECRRVGGDRRRTGIYLAAATARLRSLQAACDCDDGWQHQLSVQPEPLL